MKKTAPVRIVDKSGATRYLISEKTLMRLQEQQDIMEAEKALKRIRSGKEKVMTADQLLDYLGV